MTKKMISRRNVLKGLGLSASAVALGACAAPPAPAANSAPAATTAPAAAAPANTAAPAAAAPTAVPAPTITPVPAVPQPDGSTKISFWFGLGGNLGNVVREVVNKYNQSQKKYYVDAVFQASYDDTINKINAALAGGDLPNVVQIFDAGTQRMIDSKRIIPVQDLVERDGIKDVVDDLEPAPRSYFTVDGKLYSMPFNNSTAMTYIDKKAFKEVGLDATKTIWTYNELLDAAKKLTKKDADGKVTRTGIAFAAEAWFFEQQHAVHKAALAEPDNGRKTRATKYLFNDETGTKWLEFLKKAVDDGSATYYGTNASNGPAAFVKGEAAICFQSIASLRGTVASAEKAGKGVEVGVVYMPRRDGADVGRTIIGGASLWVTNQGDKVQQDGAWDFIKFAVKTETQAFWSANTGYYPVRRSAYDQPEMKEALQKYPQFQVAIDQIRSAPEDVFNSGCISGTFVPMRQEVQKAMDAFWSGKTATAQAALDEAVKKANEQLDEYNATVKA